MIHTRLGCSTISFRHLPSNPHSARSPTSGFAEIDLGALPGVCDHVPYVLDRDAVDAVAATVRASGLRVRSINGDIGDLNARWTPTAAPPATVTSRCSLRLRRRPVRARWCCPAARLTTHRSTSLDDDLDLVAHELDARRPTRCGPRRRDLDRVASLPPAVLESRTRTTTHRPARRRPRSGGDGLQPHRRFRRRSRSTSSIASAGRIAHVHIRDAVPGNINLSVGNGARRLRRRAQGAGRRRLHAAISHWSWRPATSPTTNGPRPPPAPLN